MARALVFDSDAIEPGAQKFAEDNRGQGVGDMVFQVSIAISLKRIADVLDGSSNAGTLFTERLCEAISAGLRHGLSNRRGG